MNKNQLTTNKELFPTITAGDWKRSLAVARATPNSISEQIKQMKSELVTCPEPEPIKPEYDWRGFYEYSNGAIFMSTSKSDGVCIKSSVIKSGNPEYNRRMEIGYYTTNSTDDSSLPGLDTWEELMDQYGGKRVEKLTESFCLKFTP